jgi:hypothetical protein
MMGILSSRCVDKVSSEFWVCGASAKAEEKPKVAKTTLWMVKDVKKRIDILWCGVLGV